MIDGDLMELYEIQCWFHGIFDGKHDVLFNVYHGIFEKRNMFDGIFFFNNENRVIQVIIMDLPGK